MPCHKDLAHVHLNDSNVNIGSALTWSSNRTGMKSLPDLQSWDPARVREQGKKTEMRHVDILRQSAARHILKCGHLYPRMRCDTNLEESRWHRKIAPDAPP